MTFKEKIKQILSHEKLIQIICLYSLFENKLIGKIIAELMSIYENEDYEYLEVIDEQQKNFSDKEKKEAKGKTKECLYVVAKLENFKDKRWLNKKEIITWQENHQAIILHETNSPLNTIPLFTTKNYLDKIKEFKKFPYVLEFIDFVISKKSKINNYIIKTPNYSKIELYNYLNEFLKLKKEKTKQNEELNLNKVITLLLKKENN